MSESKICRRAWIQSIAGGAATLSAATYLRAFGPEKRLRAAVIGRTGHGDYGHGLDKVWLKVPEAELVAVADDDPKGLSEAATRLKLKKTYSDYREMLDKEKPDVLSIAPRWLDKHYEMAIACAERGIHMYMEKPFVRTLAEADNLIAACKRTGAKLAIACQARYSPKVILVKRLIEEGKIGKVLEYRARGKEDHRGGCEDLWVLGTHMVNLIRFFGGVPSSCTATLTERGKLVDKGHLREGAEGLGLIAGDHVQANYVMLDGSTAYFASRRDMGGSKENDRFAVQIFGSEGVIEVAGSYMGSVKYLPDPAWSPARSNTAWRDVSSAGIDKPETIDKVGNREGNRIAVMDLLTAIREDRSPLCDMYEGRDTLEMIHGVFESHRLKKSVSLPLVNRHHPFEML